MRKIAATVCLAVVSAGTAVLAHAAGTPDVIRFGPAPDGGERVSTSWGDYIAVDSPGGVTVMREADAAHGQGDTVTRQASGVSFGSAEKGTVDPYWVDGALPRIAVGDTQLASISPGLVFGKEGARTQRFSVIWVQSTSATVLPVLFDFDKQMSFEGAGCGFDPGSQFHHCDISVPVEALTDKAALSFISPGAAPGFMPTSTVAKMSYANLKSHAAELKRSGLAIDPNDPQDDTYRDLAKLHAMDDQIPLTPY